MALDTSIALGIRPIQIEYPVNQLSNILQLQGAQQANQLNALKMQQQQVAADRQNKLYSIMQGLPADATDEQRSSALKGSGFFDQADALDKNILERGKAKAEGQAKMATALKDFMGVQRDLSTAVMAQPTPENAMAALKKAAEYHKALGFGDLDISTDAQALAQMTSPDQIKQWAAGHALQAEKLLPRIDNLNLGDKYATQSIDPVTGKPTIVATNTIGQSADNKATTGLGYARLGEEKRHNTATEGLEKTKIDQGKVQVINDPVRGPILVNTQTAQARNAVGADGQPLQGEVPAKREANAKNLLPILDEADALIGKATGSYVGAGIDQAARAIGVGTGGDKASARLKVLEGNLMMNQPRMEGPQSDKDVAMYKQMAGQIGDSTVPASIKKEALKTIRAITEKYAGIQPSSPDDIHAQADAILRGGK